MIASVSRAQHRPEYDNAVDNNYTFALLCCGCQTLIDLNRHCKLNDPLVPTWQKTLDDFVAYSIDENGLRIGANEPFGRSHRHWSHMLMVHPLPNMIDDRPENRSVSPVPRSHHKSSRWLWCSRKPRPGQTSGAAAQPTQVIASPCLVSAAGSPAWPAD
jgi:hypothetical protein